MKLTVRGSNISGKLRQSELATIALDLVANDGELGQGMIPQPDTSGAEWQAGDDVVVTDGPGPTELLHGWIAGQTADRPEPFIGRRVHHFTVTDWNGILYGKRAVKWKRPAETDQARVLAAAAAFWPTLDTTWVLDTGTATLAAKTYDTDTFFGDLLSDVKAATAKTMYVEHGNLHSHSLSEGQTADWSIGEADPPYTDVFPIRDGTATRTRDALQLVNDVLVRNNAGAEGTATDAGSITAHDAGGLKHQAIVNVPDGVAGSLDAYAASYIAYNKDERYTYEGLIGPMDAATAGRLIPGCLVSCTQPVWKVTATVLRLARVTLSYLHPGIWYAHVYLAFPIRFRYDEKPSLGPAADVPACLVSLGTLTFSGSSDGAYPPQPCTPFTATVGSRLMCNDSAYGNPCGLGNGLAWGSTIAHGEWKGIGTIPAGAVIGRLTANVSTSPATAGAHGWQVQLITGRVPAGFYDGTTVLASDVADVDVTSDIPANALGDGSLVYLLKVPSWQEQERTVCAPDLAPYPGGDYYAGSDPTIEWFGFCDGARGEADWVGGVGAVDGTNATFELVAWDGTGVPQAKVNSLPTPVTGNGDGTVSFRIPPPAGALVTFHYTVQA